jgi:glycosyltransferase involved in cell wall biosynthesis
MRRALILRGLSGLGPTTVIVPRVVSGSELGEMEQVYGVIAASAPEANERTENLRVLLHRETANASYDVIFFELLRDYIAVRDSLDLPVVIDLDDLKSDIEMQQLRLRWNATADIGSVEHISPAPRLLRRLAVGARRSVPLCVPTIKSLRRWWGLRRMERLAVRTCSRVLVCSEDDRKRLGSPTNAVIVPNGIEVDNCTVSRKPEGKGSVVGMWGVMLYRPNADGARWFACEILSQLRDSLPDTKFVVIGNGGAELGLDSVDGVEVTGFVEDLSTRFSDIDVAVVPLRMGGGTRIKILEAWANKIPVVTTSLGGYGLDIQSGVDALVADTPRSFAAAVHLALTDDQVRRRLSEAGTERVAGFSAAATVELMAAAVRGAARAS